ncbi:unnamed protein product [Rhizoctonia solani]|uniref:Methyltransferase domain-containing protein n=1 Tax=Rhizoctonia solani TaxID=456999 RepID=A0A8H3CSE6_9AGAM|nr:unnamed protein product [Rhizoctonia solani]
MADPSNVLGELRDLHGRHFNSLNKDYMLPADSVEMKRLNAQHRMLRVALGGIYPENYIEPIVHRLAPRKGETIRICDLGSGSGDWAAEIATAFPHSEVLAIDLAPGLPVNSPANLQFRIADVTQEIPEYHNQFDLIQGRCIGNGIKDYPALFDLVHRYLKPGGILISAEGFVDLFGEDLKSMTPKEQGGLAKLFSEIARRQPSPNNTGVSRTGNFLDGWLREHGGFEDIKDHKVLIPIGWEGSVELCKEPQRAGQLMLESTRSFAGAWRPMFLSMGLPEADVDRWIALAQEELNSPETTRGYVKFRFVVARISFHHNLPVPNLIIAMNVLRASRIVARPRALLNVRAASVTASPIRSSNSAVPLANVEAQWESLSAEEQVEVHRELENLQKRDWKTLSIDEKKAAYFVAFGPHGPRTPTSPTGQGTKVIAGTLFVILAAGGAFGVVRAFGVEYAGPVPRTITKEYEQAMNERAVAQKMNPITGITSEGYKGTGFVVSK